MRRYFILRVCTCSLIISLLARGQDLTLANAFAGLTSNLTISPTEAWVDTRIDLHPGEALQINAVTRTGDCSPNGAKLRLISAPTQATATAKSKLAAAAQTWLSGQFGTGPAKPASTPQGASAASDAPPGSASESAAAAAVTSIPALKGANVPLDTELGKKVDGLPRRVNDQFNNLGDMVNFVIVGSEQQVQSAFEAAGWRLADKSVEEAVINVVLVTYEKKDYLQMPMSTLYLFNRAQDFGYEQAEAYSVVASRHHFRLWKAPFTWNGQLVWVGAGTHDIGFEKDQRNGKVTHKIDPAVDGERDYISETLGKTGKIKSMNYHLPPNPIYEARNATGAPYRSDGRLLVIFLR